MTGRVLLLPLYLALLAPLDGRAENLIANPGFAGSGGVKLGVTGTVPDSWRGFSVGGSAEVSSVPVAAGALYADSPATSAVKLKILSFGTDQGFDNANTWFRVFGNTTYRLEFYLKTANSDDSNQSCRYSFPLFDSNGKYTGRETGSGSTTARSTWRKISGPSFQDIPATYAHVAFRANNDGGENAILIALPTVSGPLERFTAPSPGELAEKQTWTATDKLIGTSYFYWYRWPDRHFFDNPAHTDDALTDHFVSPQAVNMDDKNWHKREAADAIAAGIDMLWPVYWGAPGNFDNPNWSYYWQALAPLQTALAELQAEGKTPPKIGMFYDTSSLGNGVRGALPSTGGADLTTAYGREVFYETIRSFFCNVKPRHWACIDGRPIVVLYAAGFEQDYNQAAFDNLAARFAAEFGGITPYIIRESSWNVTTNSNYRWGAALRGPYIDGIAAVGPGYSDVAVPNRSTPIRMRENGNYYRWSWLQVLRSPARLVHVETWNEMHEGTDICESAEYGRQYIDLTAHYAAHFKAGTIPNETITLHYPDPEPRPPNMADGAAYAGARFVEIYASAGQKISAGVDDRAGGDGSVTLVSHAADTYLRTEEGYTQRYAYFAVKDPFYFDQRRRVQITMEYLNEGTGSALLQYDSYNRNATFEGSYTNASALTLTNTGTAATWTCVLENARFANRQNGGSDFRFYVVNGPLYIKKLRVDVLNLPEPILRVASLSPAPGSTIRAAGQVKAIFAAGMLASSVSAYTFQLLRSGGDGILGNSDDITIPAAGYSVAGNQASLNLGGVPLPVDRYQVRLVGRGTSPVLDSSGRVLDGRFNGSFPSGDSTGGEDFVATFTVIASGDFDNDEDVDQEDFGTLQRCISGGAPVIAGCETADFDNSGYVDEADLNVFLNCLSGPEAAPACG